MRLHAYCILSILTAAAACGGNAPAPVGPAPLGSAAAVASVAPPSSSAATSDSRAAPDPSALSNDPDIRKMLKKLAVVRGLSAKKAIPGVELGRKDLIAKIKSKVLREIPPEEIRREADWLKLFGFIPTDFDYLEKTMSLLEAELAGFYEPKDGTMYLAGDLDEINSTATLAHELVHGLQDQYFDLKSRSDYKPGQSDQDTALACLAEGDATSVMIDVTVQRLSKQMTALDVPDEEFETQMNASMSTEKTRDVPQIMRSSLVAPYIFGTEFVGSLRREGGFDRVNDAWKNTPTTTEQILHLEKWKAHEAAIAIDPPTGISLGAGFVKDTDDTTGELGLRLTFEQWMSAKDAKIAASDWGGDRGSLFIRGSELAAIERVRFDPGTSGAKRAFDLLVPALEKKTGHASAKRPDFLCIERRELGPLAVRVKNNDVVISAGPTKRKDTAWASTGGCALAERWTREVTEHD